MYFLIFSLFFCFLAFEIDKCDWSPQRQNSWKSLYFRKSFKECIFFFFWNTVEFLSLDHMRLWASHLSFWRVDRTEASPGGESSEFMAGSTCSVCQRLWCHSQIKTIPSAVYRMAAPRLDKFVSSFLHKSKAVQMLRTLKDQTLSLYILAVLLCEREWTIFTSVASEGFELSRGENWLCVSHMMY